jgi:hypothetical protein
MTPLLPGDWRSIILFAILPAIAATNPGTAVTAASLNLDRPAQVSGPGQFAGCTADDRAGHAGTLTITSQEFSSCSADRPDSSAVDSMTQGLDATEPSDVGSGASPVYCGGVKCHGNEHCEFCYFEYRCLRQGVACIS